MLGIKRDKLDVVFSELVRERAGWTCEYSGRYYPEGQRQGLHCSHLFSRRNKGTRWSGDNAFAHGFHAHEHLGSNPVEFTAWARTRLGDLRFEAICRRARRVAKYSARDREEIYRHLKTELARMQAMRAEGMVGYIDFAAFD